MRSSGLKRTFLSAILLSLLICLVPATSSAAVFISVAFAPPVLPVYDQPPCPEDGWLWTPGYWAYGDDGYYWVPGTWVPAPFEGALWTPGYWGWGGGLYIWHPGYWGRHVGYYGGVNYGFGYMGIGFVGGMWAGGTFRYNTAVMHVNRTVIHNTYEDRTIVRNYTVVNDRHVAYSGGPGGIDHRPTPEEDRYTHEQHTAPTDYQTRHESAARSDVNNYARHNGGHPADVATQRPMTGGPRNEGGTPNANRGPENRGPENRGPVNEPNHGGNPATNRSYNPGSNPGSNPGAERDHSNPGGGRGSYTPNSGNQPAPQTRTMPETRTMPQNRPAPESRPMPENRPAPQTRTMPESRPMPENRPAPESRPAPQPHEGGQPHGGGEPHGGGQPHGGGGGHEKGH
ncbi:MAG TPA: hypothetical protein VMT38_00915 [Terracidiphilus sp.]|nr:hypothetical protein [Terracidiphilus sp.]